MIFFDFITNNCDGQITGLICTVSKNLISDISTLKDIIPDFSFSVKDFLPSFSEAKVVHLECAKMDIGSIQSLSLESMKTPWFKPRMVTFNTDIITDRISRGHCPKYNIIYDQSLLMILSLIKFFSLFFAVPYFVDYFSSSLHKSAVAFKKRAEDIYIRNGIKYGTIMSKQIKSMLNYNEVVRSIKDASKKINFLGYYEKKKVLNLVKVISPKSYLSFFEKRNFSLANLYLDIDCFQKVMLFINFAKLNTPWEERLVYIRGFNRFRNFLMAKNWDSIIMNKLLTIVANQYIDALYRLSPPRLAYIIYTRKLKRILYMLGKGINARRVYLRNPVHAIYWVLKNEAVLKGLDIRLLFELVIKRLISVFDKFSEKCIFFLISVLEEEDWGFPYNEGYGVEKRFRMLEILNFYHPDKDGILALQQLELYYPYTRLSDSLYGPRPELCSLQDFHSTTFWTQDPTTQFPPYTWDYHFDLNDERTSNRYNRSESMSLSLEISHFIAEINCEIDEEIDDILYENTDPRDRI